VLPHQRVIRQSEAPEFPGPKLFEMGLAVFVLCAMDGAHHTVLQGFGGLDLGASDGILDLSAAHRLAIENHCTITDGGGEAASADLHTAQNCQHHGAEDQAEAQQTEGASGVCHDHDGIRYGRLDADNRHHLRIRKVEPFSASQAFLIQ